MRFNFLYQCAGHKSLKSRLPIERFRRDFNALLKREGKLLLNAYLSCCTDDLV